MVATAQVSAKQWEVRVLQSSDAPAVCHLFEQVFKQPMSPEQHSWKYRPATSCAVGVFLDGELLGHYGGLGVNISCKGKPARAVQIVDVMVSSAGRQGVRKQSPFFLAGREFLERFIGYDNPYLLGYGFPSDRHMQLAVHMQLYAPVGRMFEISWPLPSPAAKLGLLHKLVRLDLTNLEKFKPALDTLWQHLRDDLPDFIAVEKDAAFIEWRYLEKPDQHYQLYLLCGRLTDKPLAVMVLKQAADHMLLLDFVGPLRVLPTVLQVAQWQAQQLHFTKLITWCSEKFVRVFATGSASSKPLPITTPANIWTAGPTQEELINRWWLLPGDTDYL